MRLIKLLPLAFLIFALPLSADDGKTTGEHMDDAWLHTKVKTKLTAKQGMSINIEVYKGLVQLAGFTTDPDAKTRLPDAASRVKGVRKVYNQIIVVEDDRSAGEALDDGVLVAAVEGAMADVTSKLAAQVNTESNRGRVLLSGFIDSEAQRSQILEIVNGVKGVKEIIDGMNLKSDA